LYLGVSSRSTFPVRTLLAFAYKFLKQVIKGMKKALSRRPTAIEEFPQKVIDSTFFNTSQLIKPLITMVEGGRLDCLFNDEVFLYGFGLKHIV
jgi:hypothetical protein